MINTRTKMNAFKNTKLESENNPLLINVTLALYR